MILKRFRKFYANPGNPFYARPVAAFWEFNKNWSMQVQFPNISEKTLARVTNLPVLYHMNDANDFPRGQSETGFLKFPEYLARLS